MLCKLFLHWLSVSFAVLLICLTYPYFIWLCRGYTQFFKITSMWLLHESFTCSFTWYWIGVTLVPLTNIQIQVCFTSLFSVSSFVGAFELKSNHLQETVTSCVFLGFSLLSAMFSLSDVYFHKFRDKRTTKIYISEGMP